MLLLKVAAGSIDAESKFGNDVGLTKRRSFPAVQPGCANAGNRRDGILVVLS